MTAAILDKPARSEDRARELIPESDTGLPVA